MEGVFHGDAKRRHESRRNKCHLFPLLSPQYKYNTKGDKMHGRYHDPRIYEHLAHTYTRVPYLDHQILNIQTSTLRESRRADHRANTAQQGLDRTKGISQKLQTTIRDSRARKEQQAQQFLISMEQAQEACLQKEKSSWSDFHQEQQEKGVGYLKDQLYLSSLLKSNSTKAESRLTSVRRWG